MCECVGVFWLFEEKVAEPPVRVVPVNKGINRLRRF